MIEKYLSGKKLTPKEKKQIFFTWVYSLCVSNTTHSDIIIDWMEDQALSAKSKDILKFRIKYLGGATKSFISLFSGEKENNPYVDHEIIERLYLSVSNRDELLRYFKITPRKIDDLLLDIDFNLPCSKRDLIDAEIIEKANAYFSNESLEKNIKFMRAMYSYRESGHVKEISLA